MPIGILINASAILIGGLIGATFGKRITGSIKSTLPTVFGIIAFTLGISLVIHVKYLPAVALSLILGTVIGELLKIEQAVHTLAGKLQARLSNSRTDVDPKVMAAFVNMLILFCFSATGIFGSMAEGMSGDHSILILKSILDFFTAIIFAATAGTIIALIAIPQAAIFLTLFASASLIMPLVTDFMMADFKACGGMITLCLAFRMLELKSIKVLNMLPALLLVMPLSFLWSLIV